MIYLNNSTLTAQADGKGCRYKDYSPTFSNYKLDELRCAPNTFDILQNTAAVQDVGANTDCDVYLSYCPCDSVTDVKAKLAKAPKGNYENANDPIQ